MLGLELYEQGWRSLIFLWRPKDPCSTGKAAASKVGRWEGRPAMSRGGQRWAHGQVRPKQMGENKERDFFCVEGRGNGACILKWEQRGKYLLLEKALKSLL